MIKYSDLLKPDGTIDTAKIAQLRREVQAQGVQVKRQADQVYNMYARRRTVPQMKPVGNELRVFTTARVTVHSTQYGRLVPVLVHDQSSIQYTGRVNA